MSGWGIEIEEVDGRRSVGGLREDEVDWEVETRVGTRRSETIGFCGTKWRLRREREREVGGAYVI